MKDFILIMWGAIFGVGFSTTLSRYLDAKLAKTRAQLIGERLLSIGADLVFHKAIVGDGFEHSATADYILHTGDQVKIRLDLVAAPPADAIRTGAAA